MEAAVAVVGIIVCGIVAMIVFASISDGDSPILRLSRYTALICLSCLALYLLIRFIHWSWDTALPFVGTN
jgi:hypothetical protein